MAGTPATEPAPVVCGVDFSEASRQAAIYAAALAARLGCRLLVVSAVEPLLTEAARLRRELDPFVAQVSSDLRAFAFPLALEPERVSFEVPAGAPAPALLAAAARIGAQLIVVGTRGRGLAARLFLGSTTLRLLRATPVPVLVTDWDASSAAPGSGRAEVSRLICGVDFSDGARATVDVAARLAADLGAGLTLVHAVAPATVPAGWDGLKESVERDLIAQAGARLEDMARTLAMPASLSVRLGSAADALAAEAAGDPRAMVATGLRGNTHHRAGSTALRVVSLTSVPVLAVPC